MEAKIEKKATEGKFKTWKMRCWRIRDRRLIHYNSSCTDWTDYIASKIKLDIDLARMTSVSFYPKSNPKPNFLRIKHPEIGNNKNIDGLLLRFGSSQKPGQDIMYSWLKVLVAWARDNYKNRIYVAIPSNFSYALWNLLNALYDHPHLLTTEGIFRKESGTVRIKHELCNDILYELVSLEHLKTKYNDIDLLAKSLQYVLSSLPSSIFGDHEFEQLLETIKQYNVQLISNKDAKNVSDKDLDNDVAGMSYGNLLQLRKVINGMYLHEDLNNKYRHRYGLISLILHLIKQVTMNVNKNRMSCHAMCRLFSMCFESKQCMQNKSWNPMRSLLLVKILIYHSYFLFPVRKWRMKEIVIAEKQEQITMEKYQELKLTKKEKKNRLKKMSRDPPTNNYDSQLEINNMNMNIPPPPIDVMDHKDDKDEIEEMKMSQFKKKQKDKLKKLVRYQSHDDLDIGNYERKQSEIFNLAYDTKSIYHHEAIHTKQRRQSISNSNSLAKHKSFDEFEDELNDSKPGYGKRRSVSVPNIPAIKSPSMSTLTGFAVINQNKISEFSGPCYLNDGMYGEYIYFICKDKCFRYDITYNSYKLYMNYSNDYMNVLGGNYSVCMDGNGKRMFVIGGNYEFIEFMNVNNSEGNEYEWNDKNVRVYGTGNSENKKQQIHYNINRYGNDVGIIFIERDICELHVIGGELNNCHMRWDEHFNKMFTLYEFDKYFKSIKGHSVLYINNEWHKLFKSKLLLLGGVIDNKNESKRILYCDIKENVKKCVWNVFMELPISLAYFGAIVYKNIFILIFGGITENNKILNDIWYLNINSKKWKKSKIKCPMGGINGWYVILTDNNMIHLFQRYGAGHYTIKVNDIISDNELQLAEKEQENMYKMGHIAQKTTLEIERQKEIFYKTSSKNVFTPIISTKTSMASVTPIPNEYDITKEVKEEEVKEEEKKEEIIVYEEIKKEEKNEKEIRAIDIKPMTKKSLYDKYGISVSPKSMSNELSERLMQQEIENERFTCKLRALYDWCAGLCGSGGDTNSDIQSTHSRVQSNSNLDDNKNDSD